MIKEKFWSLGNTFKITDAEGAPAFTVKGKAFSWGDKLSLQNMAGKELAFISQKLLSWLPKYEIYRDGQLFAEIRKEFTWFKKEFTLDEPGPNDYTIKGSFWEHQFQFLRSDIEVATISKAIWTWNDTYGIEIRDGEDDLSILAACIVIDQVLHDERHHHP